MRLRRQPRPDPVRAALLLSAIVRAHHGTCTAGGPFEALAEQRLAVLIEEAAKFLDGLTHPDAVPPAAEPEPDEPFGLTLLRELAEPR